MTTTTSAQHSTYRLTSNLHTVVPGASVSTTRQQHTRCAAQPHQPTSSSFGLSRRQQLLTLRPQASASSSSLSSSDAGDGTGSSSSSSSNGIGGGLVAFWKFLRPHTIRGTLLGTTAVTSRALMENSHLIDWGLLPRALLGLLALLCGNGYIVGINQVYDVDIDVVNKPFLPVASGELTPMAAWMLCFGLAATGFTIVAKNFGPLITGLYSFGLLLGTVYSVPPLRLKQYAVPAFMIIATVRGFLLNFGVYHATRAALGLPFQWSPAIGFITVFVTLFAVAIAITKDLPDVTGDRANGIKTFATEMGVKTVSLLGIALLFSNYSLAVFLALRFPASFNTQVMAPAHLALALVLLIRAWRLDRAGYSKDAIQSFYRWIWNLFYAEYVFLPFI